MIVVHETTKIRRDTRYAMTAARVGYEGRVSTTSCSVGSTDRCSSRVTIANAAVAVAGVVVLVGIVDW